MPGTAKALELQLAQEYTGQQIDLFYQAAQWRDIFCVLPSGNISCISAVSNLGDDANWTGHDLAQANLFAYGRLAWTGVSEPEAWAKEWAELSFPRAASAVTEILLSSPDTFEKYTAPLGIGFMVTPQTHYGPSPDGYEYASWGTYHRADRKGIGVDRTLKGSGFTAQYPAALQEAYNDPDRCPERLLLFFHRLDYSRRMKDGRTLLQHIYDDHFEGAEEAALLKAKWESLQGMIPQDVYARVLTRFRMQAANAEEWRDVVNSFLYRFSGVPDAMGRKIWP
jgi:alpha-glucuronidase